MVAADRHPNGKRYPAGTGRVKHRLDLPHSRQNLARLLAARCQRDRQTAVTSKGCPTRPHLLGEIVLGPTRDTLTIFHSFLAVQIALTLQYLCPVTVLRVGFTRSDLPPAITRTPRMSSAKDVKTS